MRFPSLYQLNTRVLLHELGTGLGRAATLDDVPDARLERLAGRGFSWVWWLGVWKTGARGREIASREPTVRAELERALPGLTPDDIVSSPFAVTAYDVDPALGGDGALARLRARMRLYGLSLLLDFVPNHIALDHPWVYDHPERLIHGSEEDLAAAPQNYARLATRAGPAILAHGRDPYLDGWSDTVQLNFRHAGLRAAQRAELHRIATRCDGVRCDMAMLVLPDVFQRTWGHRAGPDGAPLDASFWVEAIADVRRASPDFVFMAEVYWGLDARLQEQGFDFTYDKTLYDLLRAGPAAPVREHLGRPAAFNARCVRFLENHDEARAALTFEATRHRAAAVLTLLAPGLRLVHDGQLEGRRIRVPMQLGRRPPEPVDEALRAFYDRLLTALARPAAHDGQWTLWACRRASPGDASHDSFIVSTWERGDERLLVVVNQGAQQARCRVTLGLPGLRGRRWMLRDLLSDARHERDGDELASDGPDAGLFLELPAWGHHLFALDPR